MNKKVHIASAHSLGLCRQSRSATKINLNWFVSGFQSSIQNFHKVLFKGLRATFLTCLISGCKENTDVDLMLFLAKHPQFYDGYLLEDCSIDVSPPHHVSRVKSDVVWRVEHDSPYLDIFHAKEKYVSRYRIIYSRFFGITQHDSLPWSSGTYLVTGWMADGTLICETTTSYSQRNGIFFIQNVELVGE